MAQITIKTTDGEFLDRICHQHYEGRPKAIEAVLAANPGLSKLGPVLPANVKILLPDLPPIQKQVIKLWD